MDEKNLTDGESEIDPVRNSSKEAAENTFYENLDSEVSNGVERETEGLEGKEEMDGAEESLEETEEKIENKIRELKENIKECEKQKNEYLAGWQRAKADFINARKDEEKIREEIINFQKENIL